MKPARYYLICCHVCNIYARYLEDHENNPVLDRNDTLGEFVRSHGYLQLFQDSYHVQLLIKCNLFIYTRLVLRISYKLNRLVFAADSDVWVHLVLSAAGSVGPLGFHCALILL
jgi:hypothetical protein